MVRAAKILDAKVMHKRFFPKENAFTYKVYYLCLPIGTALKNCQTKWFSFEKFNLFSFRNKDHGSRDGKDLQEWIDKILLDYDLMDKVHEIELITMPRLFGFVFNPVSFWLCFNDQKQLLAVICEVNNTFGETHSYICRKQDLSEITATDSLKAEKLFHVSPFIKREGYYKFQFHHSDQNVKINIDLHTETDALLLATSVVGKLKPLTDRNLWHSFWSTPLLTLKVVFLINYQAIKLVLKGIRFYSKPPQTPKKISSTSNLTKK